MYIPTEMIFSDYRVGCTYLQNDWVLMPFPIAHGPSLGPRRAYPRRFLGRVGWTPYRTHSLGDGSKCRRGKGLKTVCLGPTRTSAMIEHDGLGITYFSVDILKDMVAC